MEKYLKEIYRNKMNILEMNFEEKKSFYNELDGDLSHFSSRNDICTPLDLVKEMVDSIPSEFWKRENVKILDPCAGNGNFPSYLLEKTNLSNIFFNEISEKRIDNLDKIFGKEINLSKKDFLKFEDREEFDLVVANPPYAKINNGKRASKNHNLSRDFVRKAINVTKENGYILFVLPNNWMSFSDRNDLPEIMSKYQFIKIDIGGAKKYFPKVGSSFTWFLLKKSKNTKEFNVSNNYFIKDEQKVKLPVGIKYIPLYLEQTTLNLIEKSVLNKEVEKYNVETNSYLHKYTKSHLISDIKTSKHKFKIIHTPSQTVWSEIPHKDQDGLKVFIPLSNQFKPFIDEAGMTQSIAFIRADDMKSAKQIINDLDDEFLKFINNTARYGNFNNVRVLQRLPISGSTKITSEQKKVIKSFNDKYYRRNNE